EKIRQRTAALEAEIAASQFALAQAEKRIAEQEIQSAYDAKASQITEITRYAKLPEWQKNAPQIRSMLARCETQEEMWRAVRDLEQVERSLHPQLLCLRKSALIGFLIMPVCRRES